MRPPKVHNIDFRRTSGKDIAAWDGFRSPRIISDLTQLRILATRLRITEPRKTEETQAEYSEYVSSILVEKKMSHLDYFKTVAEVDKWFWGHLQRTRPTLEL